ncbi:MAG: hypothetical protein Q7K29_02050 [Thermoleophilia bacterium]|nr:hypothetical protein [Thermoleophilia bacterium]
MTLLLSIYTLLMIAGSIFTLALVPRAMKDVGQERRRMEEEMPGVEFEKMVEAGYRLNTALLLLEIVYYYLLLSHAGDEWSLYYGGFTFGVIHIFYLVAGKIEKRRLSKGNVHNRFARSLIMLTASLTAVEILFLVWAFYLLLLPAPVA